MRVTSPPNRVLVNSLPKGGPHLLMSTVEVLGYKKYVPKTNEIPKSLSYQDVKDVLTTNQQVAKIAITPFSPWYVDQPTIRHWLNSVPNDQYIPGHLPWTPELGDVITELGYKHILIIRDPRAMIAALIFDTDIIPRFLTNDFESMSLVQRLNFMLEGGYAPKAKVEVKKFAEVYRSILAWNNDSNCLLVRFEDLVNEHSETQKNAVAKIASYLKLADDIPANLTKIADPNAQTFRIEQIAEWQHSIDSTSLANIMDYCEPLCQEAGY